MTITQKIIAAHAGERSVRPGQLVRMRLDLAMGNDITTPVAIRQFESYGCKQVFDPDKIAIVLDHFTPNKDIKAAAQCTVSREFARRMGIRHFYDVGRMGIEHALLPELGLVLPGQAVLGADSHTCTYGALGAFSTGVGSTDLAYALATGQMWVKVPPAIRVELTGAPRGRVSGKDVILHLIGLLGVDGARYCSLEFVGEGVAALSMDDRFTIANMAVEAGAKNGVFPVDARTRAYLAEHAPGAAFDVVVPDADANYIRTVSIDLSALDYTVALPHSPGNAKALCALRERAALDQCVIGSCTNGRLADLAAAAEVFAGRQVHPRVRAIVIPATQRIYLQALERGYLKTFVEAGCAVSTPTCGPCLGGHMGILAAGERCIATTNRNFVGRMGHTASEVYLASPAVAAASAVAGHIASPEEI